MASVFLSYDHEDADFARPIAKALEKAGHSVWYDRHIHGGAQYSRRIEQELDTAEAVVVLWSENSLDSAWVRDEAAEGRDREKLVPLSLGGVTAPIGFRQFQTIALGDWNGRGKMPYLADLLQAIDSQAGTPTAPSALSASVAATPPAPQRKRNRQWLIGGVAAGTLAIAGFAGWTLLGRGNMPVVEVVAANAASGSQSGASDLFVKLGSLAQVGQGKWKLVDANSATAKPDLIFRTADTSSGGRPQSSLVLLDGRDDSLLWSRDFSFPAGGEADLRQQLSLTAGRVLGCALESRAAGGLRRDLLRIFLTTCALIAETSNHNPEKIVVPLRAILSAEPKFEPAWGRLLYADIGTLDIAAGMPTNALKARAALVRDMEAARKLMPDLPELKLAEATLLPPTDYERAVVLLAEAVALAPEKPELLLDQASALMRIGRMFEAADAARRAADADPLSPGATAQLIMILGYAGQLDRARQELSRAERVWAGTGSLRDAQWAFHLRYGDPRIARQYASFNEPRFDFFLAARADPSPANVERLASRIRPTISNDEANAYGYGFAIQAFAEFNQLDDLFALIDRSPTDVVARNSYLLFRPAFTTARRDPRFITVANKIGLTKYWLKSGEWPDFCSDSALTYNCKAEAAKRG